MAVPLYYNRDNIYLSSIFFLPSKYYIQKAIHNSKKNVKLFFKLLTEVVLKSKTLLYKVIPIQINYVHNFNSITIYRKDITLNLLELFYCSENQLIHEKVNKNL